jgi:nucleoside-diphosphate-sugar epimerase
MSSDEVVLITGGTGAIGWPLATAVAKEASEVVLLARGSAPASRLALRLVRGDVLEPGSLGMAPDVAASVRARVTRIVHAAALTRFDAPLDAVRRVNVDGTRHVLAFASSCPRLRGICALSTIYVAGRRTGRILESELEHDCGFVNAYEQSKHEAEQLLREWMPRLPITVCRLSTVLGDSASGEVYRLAAVHHAIRFLYHSLLPMIPGAPDSPVDLIATDYAVAAVRQLSGGGFVAGGTFHLSAGADTMSECELIDLVVDAFLRYRPAWRRKAIEKPVIVDLDTFELFRRSVDAVADQALRAPVAVLSHFAPQLSFAKRFDDERCRAALAAAGIVRPPIRETLARVVEHLIEHNWVSGEHRMTAGAHGV